MTSELQRTILTIILSGDNTLDPGEKRRTNWPAVWARLLPDLVHINDGCLTFRCFWYSNTAQDLAFLVCLFLLHYEMPSGSTCVCGHQPSTPCPSLSLPRLPSTGWGSTWGEVVIQLVKGGGSSHIGPKGFSLLLSSALSGSPKLRALFSAGFPREKRTKIPQRLAGGDANKCLVPDECHCLWSPGASNMSLITS